MPIEGCTQNQPSMKKFFVLSILLFGVLGAMAQGDDDCSSVSPINLACGHDDDYDTNNPTGPDAEPVSCLSDVLYWHAFTFDPGVLEFTIVGTGDVGIFEGSDCASFSELDCTSNATITITPGETYYFALEDGAEFNLTTSMIPPNEECGDAASLGENGSDTGTNVCATPPAGACSGDHSVWWEVDISTPGSTLVIEITGGTIANAEVAIYDGCVGTQLDGMNCTSIATASCLPAGPVFIEVSSATADAGTITIESTTTQPGPPEDICANALDINFSASAGILGCGDNGNQSGDTNACPDVEAQGCMVDVEGIWYTFTTDATLEEFDIDGDYELFEGSCNSLTPLAECGPNTIMADAGLTYYVLVGPGGVDFTTPPAAGGPSCNDALDGNSVFSGSTCCSTSGEVWVQIPLSGTPGGTIAGIIDLDGVGFDVELYQGCGGGPLQSGVGSVTFEPESNCDDLYLRIFGGSGCGDWEYTVTEATFCVSINNADCGSAETIPQPVTNSGSPSCIEGCNLFLCPPEGQSACGNNTVWYEVLTDADASVMFISLNALGTDAPIGDVNIVVDQDACGENLVGCTGYSPGDDPIEVSVNANLSYFIGIQSSEAEAGEFEICVETQILVALCSEGSLVSERPDNDLGDPEGPFCPGEKVKFSYTVDFTIDPAGQGNNCQWIQGIIPSFGAGWDLVACPAENQGPDGWNWFDEGEVSHNVNSPVLSLQPSPVGGTELVFGGGGLGAGDLLPGGWWFTSQGGGATCSGSTDPNTTWGLPAPCGSSVTVEFEFFLQVKENFDLFACSDPDYLKVHMFTMADGQTGCWSNNACASDQPAIFPGAIDCDALVGVTFDGERYVCQGESTDITVSADDGSSLVVVEFDDENPGGAGPIDEADGSVDINEPNENDGCDLELVIFKAFTINPISGCMGPPDTFHVFMVPEIQLELPDDLIICPDDPPLEWDLNTMCSSGYNYDWDPDDSASGQMVTLPHQEDLPAGHYIINVTVTDDFGCSLVEIVEYDIQEDPMQTIDGDLTICTNGAPDELCAVINNSIIPPGDIDDYLWSFTPSTGIVAVGGDFDNPCILIDDAASTPGVYQLKLSITVNDCIFDITETLTIGTGPTLNLMAEACQGDSIKIVGRDTGMIPGDQLYITQSPSGTLMPGDTIAGPLLVDSLCVWVRDFATPLSLHTSGGCTLPPVGLTLPPKPSLDLTVTESDLCDGESTTLTVNNAAMFPGGVTFNDGSSTQPGPSITVTPSATLTYTVTGIDANGCDDVTSQIITVNPNPEVEITGSASFCAGQSTDLTATPTGGVAPFTYVWSTGDADQTVTVSMPGTITVTATDANGCVSTDMVNVSESTELEPMVSDQSFCESNPGVTLDGGAGFDTYEWIDAAGVSVGTMQTLMTNDAGTYTLIVEAGGCNGMTTAEVTSVAELPPAIDESQTIVLCNGAGTDPDFIDLTALVAPGVTGVWTRGTDNVADPTNESFNGAPAGTVTYTFTSNNATAPCMNAEYQLIVTVRDCGCPDTSIAQIQDFCIGDGAFDLDIITITTEPGTWSIDPPTGVDLTGDMITVDDTATAGTYMLTYTLSGAAEPGCDVSSSINFTVWQALTAELMNTTACDTDQSGDPTVVDLDELIISGDVTGTWTSNDASIDPATNEVDFNGLPQGNYTFTYTLVETGSACNPFAEQVRVTVIDCSCPILTLDQLPNQCNSGGNVNLNMFLTNDGGQGSWTFDPPTLSETGGIVNFGGADPGTYMVTFSIDVPITGCTNSVTEPLLISPEPMADVETDLVEVCNGTTLDLGLPTSINLDDYVTGDAGVWTVEVDYNGGVIDDINNVDFLDANAQNYLFTYTTNTAVAPCDDNDYILMVAARACNCPVVPFDNVDPVCSSVTGIINLNDYIVDIATAPPGMWSAVGTTPVDASGDVDVSGLTPGIYLFRYTYDPQPPVGCTPFEDLPIMIDGTADFTVMDFQPCNNVVSSGDECVNITSLITGGPGTWIVPANYPGDASDLTAVCFDGLPIGEQYIFGYAIDNSANSCPDDTLFTTLTVVDCNCPNIIVSEPDPICNSSSTTFNVTTLEGPLTTAGSWTALDTNGDPIGLLFGESFDPFGQVPGDYTLIFTPDNIDPACDPQTSEVILTIVADSDAGDGGMDEVCAGDAEMFDLFTLVVGGEAGGTWTETSAVPSIDNAFDAAGGTFNSAAQREGTYTFQYTLDGAAPCTGDATTVTVAIVATPVADAGVDGVVSCDASFDLGGPGTSMGNHSYAWTLNGNNVGAEATLTATQEGVYILTVTDDNTLCTSSDEVEVTSDGNTVSVDPQVTDPNCQGEAGLLIVAASGGDGNFQYSLDGGPLQSSPEFDNLVPGQTYELTTIDGNGCQVVQQFTVGVPVDLNVDAGENRDVDFSETAQYELTVGTTVNPADIVSLTWEDIPDHDCENGIGIDLCPEGTFADCATIMVNPDIFNTYRVTMVDINGCVITDCVTLRERLDRDVYIPTIFSPNAEDGSNQVFRPFYDQFIEGVRSFNIYDRWGELVFTADLDLLNSTEDYGWNGAWGNDLGRLVEQGVYVYVIEIQYVGDDGMPGSGQTEIFAGDITIIR